MEKNWVIKGDFAHSTDPGTIQTYMDQYLVCTNGIIQGIFGALPEEFAELTVYDYSGRLIVPGLSDLHVHAPQYAFRGLGMDLELLEWLNVHTFPEESKYADLAYAEKAYGMFAENMRTSATTRANVFATVHVPATLLLMELLEKAGISGYAGKVNMDRNAPDTLAEASADASEKASWEWLEKWGDGEHLIHPILTPRFIPSCSDDLMRRLQQVQERTGLPVQSHLSENLGEIAWVQELCPDSGFYGDVYDQYGMFGKQTKTVMAHCVYSGDDEISRMKENRVFVAHCPQSNTNLASGIAPVRRYLDEGVSVGLGSDVAGGASLSIFRAMADAVQVSKLRWRLVDASLKPLTVPEAFYLGTKGGGAFFGKTGSFEKGYEADVVVLDESAAACPLKLTVEQRLERFIYLSGEGMVLHKFVKGRKIF